MPQGTGQGKKKRSLDELLSQYEQAESPKQKEQPRRAQARSLDDILKSVGGEPVTDFGDVRGGSSSAVKPPDFSDVEAHSSIATSPEAGLTRAERAPLPADPLVKPERRPIRSTLTPPVSAEADAPNFLERGGSAAKGFLSDIVTDPIGTAKHVAKGIADPFTRLSDPNVALGVRDAEPAGSSIRDQFRERKEQDIAQAARSSMTGDAGEDVAEAAVGAHRKAERTKDLMAPVQVAATVLSGPAEAAMAKTLMSKWGAEFAGQAIRSLGVKRAMTLLDVPVTQIAKVVAAHTAASAAVGAGTMAAFTPDDPLAGAVAGATISPVLKGAHATARGISREVGVAARSAAERIDARRNPPPDPDAPYRAEDRASRLLPRMGDEFREPAPTPPPAPKPPEARVAEWAEPDEVDFTVDELPQRAPVSRETSTMPVENTPPARGTEAITPVETIRPRKPDGRLKPAPGDEVVKTVNVAGETRKVSGKVIPTEQGQSVVIEGHDKPVKLDEGWTVAGDDAAESIAQGSDSELTHDQKMEILAERLAEDDVVDVAEAPARPQLVGSSGFDDMPPLPDKPKAEAEEENTDYRMTQRQFQEYRANRPGGIPILNYADKKLHEAIVTKAVQEGKDVPELVLRDYPHLQKQTKGWQAPPAGNTIGIDGKPIDRSKPAPAPDSPVAGSAADTEPSSPVNKAFADWVETSFADERSNGDFSSFDKWFDLLERKGATNDDLFNLMREVRLDPKQAVKQYRKYLSEVVTSRRDKGDLSLEEELQYAVEDGEMTQREADEKLAFNEYSQWRKGYKPPVKGDDVATFDEWLVDEDGVEYAREILGREPVDRAPPEIDRPDAPTAPLGDPRNWLDGTFKNLNELQVGQNVVIRATGAPAKVIKKTATRVHVQTADGATGSYHPTGLYPEGGKPTVASGETTVTNSIEGTGEPNGSVRQSVPGGVEGNPPEGLRQNDTSGARGAVAPVGRDGLGGLSEPTLGSQTEVSAAGRFRVEDPTPAESRGDGAGDRDERNAVEPSGARGIERGRDSASVTPAATNYRIEPDDEIGQGGAVRKAKQNIAAIELLKQLEKEGRLATKEEQKVLVQYVGWGMLAGAVSRSPSGEWAPLNAQVKSLLTEEELDAARRSTLNAHYTSPTVINAMWDAALRLGLTNYGLPLRFLEPSMGVGHFIGFSPEGHKDGWTGVELDNISGQISRHLYPEADIRIEGFQEAKIADNSIDVAISNVPFGKFPVIDKRYPKFITERIHNYFFARTLDLLRPGGLMLYVSSKGTMDASDMKEMREYLMERGHFLGSIRLPDSAFKANAGTKVVTDFLVIQKHTIEKEARTELDKLFVGVTPIDLAGKPYFLNDYYIENPKMMIGVADRSGSMYGPDQATWSFKGDIADELKQRIAMLPENALKPPARQEKAVDVPLATGVERAPDAMRDGQMKVSGGKVMQKLDGDLREVALPKSAVDRVKRLVTMRDMVRELLAIETADGSETAYKIALTGLNKEYDAFVKQYGAVNKEVRRETSRILKSGETQVLVSTPNLNHFEDDPESILVSALEEYDPETDVAKKAGLLAGTRLKKAESPQSVADPVYALPIVLSETGRADIKRIAELTGQTEEKTIEQLKGIVFKNPSTGQFETKETYLSGTVRAKLKEAKKRVAKGETEYEANVTALEQVQPKDLLPTQITAALGAPWIPTTDIEDFIRETFGASTAKVSRFKAGAAYQVSVDSYTSFGTAAQNTYGTRRKNGIELLELALNQQKPVVRDRKEGGGSEINQGETLAAEEKQQALKDLFKDWVWKEDKRSLRLLKTYNTEMNDKVKPVFDGSHLKLPGAATHINGKEFHLFPHQLNAIWRALQTGNTMLAHEVGAGKTYTMAAIAIEAKRMGFAKKPMQIVPNHMINQFAREFQGLYPNAKLLIVSKDDLHAEARRRFVARATLGDWDAIIMTHRSFETIRISPKFEQKFVKEIRETLVQQIEEAKAEKNRDLTKEIEKALIKLEERLDALKAEAKKDDLVTFEELGVDLLLVDEAHNYKNLYFPTKMREVGIQGSERAFDLFIKSRYLDQINPGRGLVFATGTPIANAVAEAYTMLRYLQYSDLERMGIAHFDAWAASFGETVRQLELKPSGQGYRMKERFAKYKNVAELAMLLGQTWDVKTQDDMNLPRPPLLGGSMETVLIPSNEAITAYVQKLADRAAALRGKPEKGGDNMLKITTDGRHAALDLRLVDSLAMMNRETKVTAAAERIYTIWKETAKLKGTQLVFLDLSMPGSSSHERGGVADYNVYDELKRQLVEAGIPNKEIAFIHNAANDAAKAKLFQRVKAGDVRVLMGSSEKMGTGTNVQDRITHLHHLDVPHRPDQLTQRNGRALRQGNKLFNAGLIDGIRIINYVQEGSFDAYMWQQVERKQKMISQVMKAGPETRELDEPDTESLSYGEIKALASGNPLVMEKAGVDADVQRLNSLKRQHEEGQWMAKREKAALPALIAQARGRVDEMEKDRAVLAGNPTNADKFKVTIDGKSFTERSKAAPVLHKAAEKMYAESLADKKALQKPLGSFGGFEYGITTYLSTNGVEVNLYIQGAGHYDTKLSLGLGETSTLARLEHVASTNLSDQVFVDASRKLDAFEKKLRELESVIGKEFSKQKELDTLKARQKALDEALTPKPPEQHPDHRKMDTDEAPEGNDEPGGGATFYSVGDPFSYIYVALKELKKMRARRYAERQPVMRSSLPEVEARWEAAKGIRPLPYSARLKDAWESIKKVSRHFPEIDSRKDPIHALVNEQLLEVEHAKDWATVIAHDHILQVTEGLGFGEADLLTRALALNDMMKDVEAGLYSDGRELPFGYNRDALETDLEAVEQALQQNPKVQTALNKRQEMALPLTNRLVELELLPAEVLEDSRYYHRQVMEYANAAERSAGLGKKDVRNKTKGFQRGRVGGGDFNTLYQEAEFEWLSQAYREIHMAESLEKIKQLADVKPSLVTEAKVENLKRYRDKLMRAAVADYGFVPNNIDDPLAQYGQKIAYATQRIYALLDQGMVTPGEAAPFERMLDAFTHDRLGYDARNLGRSARARDAEPFRFDHPQWFAFLKFLIDRGGAGAMPAATIFKAIRDRETEMKDYLGAAYLTWEDLIPEGYDTFQPKEGSYFFRALTVEQRILDAAIASGETAAELKVQEAWVRGQDRPYWVIPEGIARTMEDFGNTRDVGSIEKGWTRVIGTWKTFQLLRPGRLLKYNFNNFSGDADAAMLYPRIFSHLDDSAADNYRFLVSRNMSDALRKDMVELVKLRVINNTLSVAEIPDVNTLPGFKRIAKSDPSQFMNLITRYFRFARQITQVRENVLRLAAYRYFLSEIEAGRAENLYASSNPVLIRAERDPKRKAAVLARDLIGDYGAVSRFTQFARDRLFPFFSWQEVNAKRYVNMIRNVTAEGGHAGRKAQIAGVLGGKIAQSLAVRLLETAIAANLFMLAAALWNALMFPEEEAAMREENRSTHIILGKDAKTGQLLSVRVEGAWADFLGWLALKDYPADVADLVKGRSGWDDKMIEAAQAPVQKVASLWEPLSKTGAELATGKRLWPDAFHPRPIRDRKEYLWQQVALGKVYAKVNDIPLRPTQPFDWVTGTIIYRTDPGEAAYYLMLDKVRKYNELNGKEVSYPEPTERSTALYYFKRAAQWGNEEQADRWLTRYYELGGTKEGARRSVARGDPLAGLKRRERDDFKETLDATERRLLEEAQAWFTEDRTEVARKSFQRVVRPKKSERSTDQ